MKLSAILTKLGDVLNSHITYLNLIKHIHVITITRLFLQTPSYKLAKV